MGAITGWISFDQNLSLQRQTLAKMSGALKRRAPKGDGFSFLTHAALCQRQAFCTQNFVQGGIAKPLSIEYKGELCIVVFSGSLYNGDKLYERLKKRGYLFATKTPHEIALYSFLEWGDKAAEKLEGAFAFAIWQDEKKRFFACRDKAGIKPFFYYLYGKGLIFGSELGAILQNPIVKPNIDSDGLGQIILLGPGRELGSGIIKGIYELKPGELLRFDINKLKTKKYFQLKAAPHTDSQKQTIEKTRELIISSTEKMSGGIDACFLSGGLDSSILSVLIANALKKQNRQLNAYSIEHIGNDKFFTANAYQPDSDKKYVQLMANFIGAKLITIELSPKKVASSVALAAKARGLPGMGDIDSSLLLACQTVKQNDSAILSGECADELFGGYPWYHNNDLLNKETFPWSDSLDLRLSLFNAEFLPKEPAAFVYERYRNIVDQTDYLPDDSPRDRKIRQMFMLNYYSFMQVLLERSDCMAAYCALDLRVPFCSGEIAKYAYNMPWELKALGGREKGIVRRAFENLLPKEIIERKKSPFPKTFNPLFLKKVKKQATAAVRKGGVLSKIINKKAYENLLSVDFELKTPWYGQLMRLPQIFAYIVQLDAFFEQNGIQTV